MKLTRIQTSNFLGARAVDIALATPVTLIAGHNGAGKSSIRDAVALALTADLGRVSLKKEAPALITDGADSALVEIDSDAGAFAVVINAAGKITDGASGRETSAALPFVLDAQRFAQLDANERRAFLFGLMDVRTDGPTVKDRLLERGCDADKAEQIAPFLRAGFEAASKEAASKARDAKAAWKTVAGGETWGEKKSAGWMATAPTIDPTAIQTAAQAVATAEEAIETASRNLGAARQKAQTAGATAARINDLHERAGRYARIADKLERDRAELKQWSGRLAELPAVTGAGDKPQTAPCPKCGTLLCGTTSGGLVAYEQIEINTYRDDQETAGKRKQWLEAVELYQRSVTNGERDLAAADAAAEELKRIEAEASEAPSDGAILEAESRVDELRATRKSAQQRLDDLKVMQRAADDASRKTEQAARHHAEVLAWIDIAEALSPDGIPGELLAAALGPINKRLAESAEIAQWPVPFIKDDMTICADGFTPGDDLRPYALMSESEKWRVDALIAEAISNHSGLRLLVLDRADVLDMAGREDLLYWLDSLAEDGEIDTALVFATLKSLPAALPDHISAVWVENGTAGQMKEAA